MVSVTRRAQGWRSLPIVPIVPMHPAGSYMVRRVYGVSVLAAV